MDLVSSSVGTCGASAGYDWFQEVSLPAWLAWMWLASLCPLAPVVLHAAWVCWKVKRVEHMLGLSVPWRFLQLHLCSLATISSGAIVHSFSTSLSMLFFFFEPIETSFML